jgi:hypothetical protein
VAKAFVDSHVRFFKSGLADNGSQSQENLMNADISIINVYAERDGMWTVLLYIESNTTNGTKRGGLAILVDPATRQVLNAAPFNPRSNESNMTPRIIQSTATP